MSDGEGHTQEVRKEQLRKRVLARFEDVISGVRAYAEVSPPSSALKLLAVMSELRTQASEFELHTRRPVIKLERPK